MKRKMYKGPFWPTLEDALKVELGLIERRPLDVVRIIVPSRLLKRHLRKALAEGAAGHAGLIFVSFNNLVSEGATPELAKRRLKPLPDSGKNLLARMAPKSLKSGDRFYPLRDMPGFAAALLATIADLKESRIKPEDLAKAAKHLPDPQKAKEIARLFDEYERIKNARKLCDDKDRTVYAIEHFKERPPLHETPLFIHGVYDATNLQRELLKSYLGDADATATVPWWRETDEFVRPYLDFLTDLGFVEATCKSSMQPQDELKPALFSAPGESREVREVVREILQYCIKHNISFDETAILLRQPDEYLPLFREEMEAAEIPYYMPDGDRLAATHAGRALNYLIELFDRKYTRSSVTRFLEGAPLKPQPGDDAPPEVERWARLAREAWIIEGRKEWEDGLASLTERRKAAIEEAEDPEGQKIIRYKSDILEIGRSSGFIKELFDALEVLPDSAPWPTYAECIADLFERLIDSEAEGWREVMNLIRSISSPFGKLEEEAELAEVAAVLLDLLNEKRLVPTKSEEHGVVVAGVMVARCVPFRVVVAPGVVERSFPRVVRQDPLLLDDERREINRIAKKEAFAEIDIKSRGRLEEDMLFRLTCRAAQEHLAISYPRIDPQGGQEKMPSTFFINAAELAEGKQVEAGDLQKYRRGFLLTPFPGNPEDAIIEMEYLLSVAHKLIDNEPGGALKFFGDPRISLSFNRAIAAEEARWGRKEFTRFDAVFSSKEALAALNEGKHTLDDHPLSPGRLENYARCPYKYYVENILRAATPDEPERIRFIEAVDRGALIHHILFRFFTDRRKKGKLPMRPADFEEHQRVMERIADKEFAAFEKLGRVGWPIIWEFTKHEIMGDLNALLRHEVEDENWTPGYFEMRFGYMSRGREEDEEFSTDKPVEIELAKDVRVRLRGRIDRVDIARGGGSIRIIDYKTGSAGGYTNNRFNGGEQLQLPLYSLAAAAVLPGGEIGPAEYRFIKGGKLGIRSFTGANDPEKLRELAVIVKTIVEGVRNGLFFMCPGNSCRYCDISHHCGGAGATLCERKRDDPRLDHWRDMKKIE